MYNYWLFFSGFTTTTKKGGVGKKFYTCNHSDLYYEDFNNSNEVDWERQELRKAKIITTVCDRFLNEILGVPRFMIGLWGWNWCSLFCLYRKSFQTRGFSTNFGLRRRHNLCSEVFSVIYTIVERRDAELGKLSTSGTYSNPDLIMKSLKLRHKLPITFSQGA